MNASCGSAQLLQTYFCAIARIQTKASIQRDVCPSASVSADWSPVIVRRIGEDRTRDRPEFGWPEAYGDPLQVRVCLDRVAHCRPQPFQ